MKIKVRNLLPNPFRNIDAYPIDREKIRQLRNSIRETSFWNNILARPAPKNGKFEIAYGHHRLVAIKEELGEEIVVDIPVRDLSDENMLKIMANENMQEWSTDWRVIVETVKAAKKFLEKHTEIIYKLGFYKTKDRPFRREVGPAVISSFLGENWSEMRTKQALRIMRDKEIQILTKQAEGSGLPQVESFDVLAQVSRIRDDKIKKKWLKQIPNKDLVRDEVREILRFENEPALAEHDKQVIRENILEGRIRGPEQIREQVEFIKVRKLQLAKETEEDKRKEELKDFINRTNELTVGLNNKLEVLVAQFKEYPETKKYLPQEEMIKFSRSLTTLLVTIKQLIDVTRGRRKEERKELKV